MNQDPLLNTEQDLEYNNSLIKRLQRGFGYLVLIVAALICAAPLLWLLDAAFRPKIEIFQVPPVIMKGMTSFASYSWASFSRAISEFNVLTTLTNSLIVAVAAISLTLFVCSLCAFAFAYMQFPGKNFFFMMILATMMLPSVTMLVPYYQVVRSIGLTNNLAGVFIPYAASAFGVFMLRQYFIKLPASLIEAAKIDGASWVKIWWGIIMPLSKPALAALTIIQFRLVWNDFLNPILILKDETLFTLPIRLQAMDSTNFNVPYDAIMATGLITALIPVTIFLLFQRQFIEGLTGGVKG